MAEMNDIVRLAVDTYKGSVEKYSTKQAKDVLRQALIEANGGSTTLNYRSIRDGKCNGLFALIEEILGATIVDGFQDDDYFNSLVEFRNVAEGDSPVFVTKDRNLYVVAKAADGTQGIRRQRLANEAEATIPTEMRIVRIYEELNRILAGRVDFVELVDKVALSFRQQLLNDIYTLWSGVTATQLGGQAFFPTAGSYNEDTLLDAIAHVEAAAGGQTATLIGTKKALRNLKESVDGDGYKDELHDMGYVGKFYGTPVVAVPQRHKPGTTDFIFDDDVITIIAGDDKPIKVVYEGDPLIIPGDPLTNADLTQEYLYGEKYGVGIILAGGNTGIGKYEMT